MNATLLVVAIIGGVLMWRLVPRMTEATRQSPWREAYRAGVRRGMSPSDAIAGALKPLRYRKPWQALSDDEVATISEILGGLRRPELFTVILATVERTGDLGHVTDGERLRAFVSSANSRFGCLTG